MNKNIAVVMGGYSSEKEISLKSGGVVYDCLNKSKYNVFRVHILKEKWVVLNDKGVEFPIEKADFSFDLDGKKVVFDAVFNAIHGAPGENGMLVAYFDMLGIPHTSAPFYQMALTFNKRDTLSVVKAYGVKTAKSVYLNQGDFIDLDTIIEQVGLPCFIKPNNSGSSYGISKAYNREEVEKGIAIAFKEDDAILIESFLDGTEVSCGVIEYQNEVIVLPLTEIVSENDFFDYEAKYEGKSQEITPARITDAQREKVEVIAKKIYTSLNMSGFTRSEFIFVNDEPHFLEMNTVPGLTKESILPQQAKAAGITLEALFENAIEMAVKQTT